MMPRARGIGDRSWPPGAVRSSTLRPSWGVQGLCSSFCLGFGRGDVADGLQEQPGVEPVHPFQGGVLDRIERLPRPAPMNDFGLNRPITVSASAFWYKSPTLPTDGSMPASSAASSLLIPDAIANQNQLRSSPPATGGRPGDGSGARPDRSDRRFEWPSQPPPPRCCDDRLNPPGHRDRNGGPSRRQAADGHEAPVRARRERSPPRLCAPRQPTILPA